jgi:DNA repair protein RadC
MESTNEIQKWQVAEIQLVYKTNVKPSERPKITTSLAAYELLMKDWDESRIELQEQFKVLLLNRANKVLGIVEISTGGIEVTVSDPKLIMIAALKSKRIHPCTLWQAKHYVKTFIKASLLIQFSILSGN